MYSSLNSDLVYRKSQAENTRKHWQLGTYNFLRKPLQNKICQNPTCQKTFQIEPNDLDRRKYCSKHCAALINNPLRKTSFETRQKISLALKGKPNPYKGTIKIPRVIIICQNPECKREIELVPYLAKTQQYCSNACTMHVVGRQTTSPKASKGKPGIRTDIDSDICFYSTWEANIARVFNLLDITWEYAPKIFDLGSHTYRPDFYLPKDNMYIEVKNFMNDYSFKRDQLFRIKYPHIKLEVLSRKEYKEIEVDYKPLIDFWER